LIGNNISSSITNHTFKKSTPNNINAKATTYIIQGRETHYKEHEQHQSRKRTTYYNMQGREDRMPNEGSPT
jgi:hypothetical protein